MTEEYMEWFGEFNIVEWDGTIDRVKVVRVWNPKLLAYDYRLLYPDGLCVQVPLKRWEELKPFEIGCP